MVEIVEFHSSFSRRFCDLSHRVSLTSDVGMSTLWRSRMKPRLAAPAKRGRMRGRQAPMMPMEDSIMGQ